MPNYRLTHEALAFLRKIPAKHARQIMEKIERLAEDPKSIPSKQLEGFPTLRRARSGEYRMARIERKQPWLEAEEKLWETRLQKLRLVLGKNTQATSA
jgi:hypothetical protein